MTRFSFLVVLIFLGSVAWAQVPSCNGANDKPPDQSPSFDCQNANAYSEKMICASPELSRLDREINAGYLELKRLLSGRDEDSLVSIQKSWLRERDQCSDTVCLKRAMLSRNEFLHNFVFVRTSTPVKDESLQRRLVDAGMAALRKEYGPDFDGDTILEMTNDSWGCELSPKGEFRCDAGGLGCATCDGFRACVTAQFTGCVESNVIAITKANFQGADGLCQ